MDGLFFIAMLSVIGACLAVADLDAALNFKADDQHNNNEGVLMRADELEILP